MPVTDFLERNVKLYGNETALVELNPEMPETRRMTWKDYDLIQPTTDEPYRREITWTVFDEKANRFANMLLSRGIKKGDKVAILMYNCLEWLPIYFGILRSGAAAVPLNFRYLKEGILHCARFAEVDAVVFGHHCRQHLLDLREELTDIRSFLFVGDVAATPSFALHLADAMALQSTADPGVPLRREDLAAIYFSSGTTGAPKAVVYTHGTLESAWQLEHGNHHQVHDDCFVLIPPLYHVGGKLHWMGNLPVGARCVMLLGFQVGSFFEAARRERISIAFLLLPWVQDILSALESGRLDLAGYDLSAWRMVHMGAQYIPPVVVRQMRQRFPALAYEVSYGLTESGGPGCLNLPADRMDKLGSVGVPAPGWEAKVADGEGRTVESGRTGELLLRGPGVMTGYYKNPELTAQALRGGWLHTGDVARTDEDGFFYIVGRIKDIIISGGENVYPVQIENHLRRHPAVQDAAVFGICDRRLGEAVVAQVELKDGAACTEEELTRFCMDLPRFQRPKRIFLGQVPRNPTGKIDKKALRSRYSPQNLFTDPENV